MTVHNWPGTRKNLRRVKEDDISTLSARRDYDSAYKPTTRPVIPLSWWGRLLRWFKHLR